MGARGLRSKYVCMYIHSMKHKGYVQIKFADLHWLLGCYISYVQEVLYNTYTYIKVPMISIFSIVCLQ